MHRRGRPFWSHLVQRFERSGLTHEAFAAQHHVSVGTLRKWIYRLRHERSALPRLLPVRVCAAVSSAPPRRDDHPPATVEALLPDGVHLRFSPGADSAYVADVVGRLRPAAC